MAIPPRWYSKKEAAAYLGCSVEFLLDLVKNGELPCSREPAFNGKGQPMFYEGWLDKYKKRVVKNHTKGISIDS